MHRPIGPVAIAVLAFALGVSAQTAAPPEPATARALASHDRSTDRSFEAAIKASDDVLWHFKLGDAAIVDKVLFTSKPEPRPAR